MYRYGWMIITAVIGAIALIGFFIFLFKDMEFIKSKGKSKKSLLLNISLLIVCAACIALSVYFYFDIQEQVRILGEL